MDEKRILSNLPLAWLEDFGERAAILEFDAGMHRDAAERQALVEIWRRYRQEFYRPDFDGSA